ncbi:hypothetical protein K438DRAFT_2020729 [Mycena galopus ATCC 62051]|nr:hypothetical protein K438DRAFT_2020729 [Mycena galopus ATCC 62051]
MPSANPNLMTIAFYETSKISSRLATRHIPPPRALFFEPCATNPTRTSPTSADHEDAFVLAAHRAKLLPLPPARRSRGDITLPVRFALAPSLCDCTRARTPTTSTHVGRRRHPLPVNTLAVHLAASSNNNIATLLEHAAHAKELWKDMVTPGVYDAPLWDVLDLVSEVVLRGMGVVWWRTELRSLDETPQLDAGCAPRASRRRRAPKLHSKFLP